MVKDMRKTVRVNCILLALSFQLVATACAGQENGDGETQGKAIATVPNENVAVAVWDNTDVDLHVACNLSGNTLYYMDGTWDIKMERYSDVVIYRRQKGAVEAEVITELKDAFLITYMVDETGNLYYLYLADNADECVTDMEGLESGYVLAKYSGEGELLYEVPIQMGEDAEMVERLGTVISGQADRSGRICFVNNCGDLYLFDAEGRFIGTCNADWDQESYNGSFCGIVNAGEEGIFTCHVNNRTVTFRRIDMQKSVLEKAVEIKVDGQDDLSLKVHSGYGRGIFILDSHKLWQYQFSDQMLTELLRWSDSTVNLSGYFIDAIGVLPGESLYLMVHQSWDHVGLLQIDYRDSSEVVQRQTVSLAVGPNVGDSLVIAASSFNRYNTEYEIEIVKLENIEDTFALYSILLKGGGPDIFCIEDMSIPPLADKGVFEDLSPYFAESSAVKERDILPSIRNAWTIDGKLICMFTDYSVSGFFVKEGTVEQGAWTPDEYISLAENNPESILFGNMDSIYQNEVLRTAIRADMKSYINYQTDSCYFENDDFISLLNRISNITKPTVTNPHVYQEDQDALLSYLLGQVEEEAQAFFQGRVLTNFFAISGLNSYVYLWEEKGYGDYADVVGYPTQDGTPYYELVPYNALAINSTSSVKEGAWAFMEFLLSKEYQDDLESFPVRQDSFDRYIMLENFTYYTIQLSEEARMNLRTLVDNAYWSATVTDSYEVIPLIAEECDAVWAGDKSAAEAAGVIQNRISLYLSE